jgi:hypothetical protein
MKVWRGRCRDRIRKCLIALDGIASSGDLVRYCWPRRSRFSTLALCQCLDFPGGIGRRWLGR